MGRTDGSDAHTGAVYRSEWIFERKLDGIRLLAFKNGPEIRLLLQVDRANHAAAHPRAPVDDGAVSWGIGMKGFRQKDVSKGFPEWLERVEVPKKDGTVHHPLVTDARTLLWVTNQNTITPHVWVSRATKL